MFSPCWRNKMFPALPLGVAQFQSTGYLDVYSGTIRRIGGKKQAQLPNLLQGPESLQ